MTNGGFLIFNNKLERNSAIKILKKCSIIDKNIFEVFSLNKNKIFIRVQVKSLFNFNKLTKNNINKAIIYEDHHKKYLEKNESVDTDFLKSNMVFITSPGKHTREGPILANNISIK